MTIFALSTVPGRAGIAIIRISGTLAPTALRAICSGDVPRPRFAALRTLMHPKSGEVLDRGLVLWFPAPASYTGEDMAELHVHGGRAVIAGLFDALDCLGLRLAEAGEFTKRAFENGKLDLTEVEGLADLIEAETGAQRKQAVAQMNGRLRERYEAWRLGLLRAMAWAEVSLDFADEGDIAADAFDRALPEVEALVGDLEKALADGRRGEIVRDGIQVAILGAPNVGKSSLLNALAGREAAIVFDEPGTTRDIIEVSLDIEGFPFVLRDTAGLRNAESPVEREGIRRAHAAAEVADIVIAMTDDPATAVPFPFMAGIEGCRTAIIAVLNKIDLVPRDARPKNGAVAISTKTGEGMAALKEALAAFARENYGGAETSLITRARHRHEIERARAALREFLEEATLTERPELAAEHLREAADALGRLTGRLDVEDVLGEIFSAFCIGK